MNIKIFWKPLLWLALICYGLLIPADELPKEPFLQIPHFDKFVHAVMFFGFSLLLFRPFKKMNVKHYFFAPLTAIFFGVILETSQQMLSQTRSSDIYDFAANLAGIILSVFFYKYLVSRRKWEKFF